MQYNKILTSKLSQNKKQANVGIIAEKFSAYKI